MKKITIVSTVILAAIIAVTAGCAKNENTSVKALSIKDIQHDPLSFQGEITINGVVAAFAPNDASIFGVVDTAELLACKNLACGAFMLPSKYAVGKPPELGDEINITGRFVQYQGGHIFEVVKIEVKRNIMPLIS